MKKLSKKDLWNTLFFFFVFSITCYLLFKDQEIPNIINTIRDANIFYLLLGGISVIIFVCCESTIIYLMMDKMNRKIPIRKCVKYSFIGFFFSYVTPSATGGQPAQIYYMGKDNVDLGAAALVLLEITVAYKAVLVLVGIGLLTLKKSFVLQVLGKQIGLFYFGIIINSIVILALILIIGKTNTVKKYTMHFVNIFSKYHIIKHKEKVEKKAVTIFRQYKSGATFLNKNKEVMIGVYIITFIQRFVMFLVTYFVYRSFGLNEYSLIEIVIVQCIISIAVDMLPLPGGIGASEKLFLIMFRGIFGKVFVLPGMLLSRGISYYLLLIISASVTFAAQFRLSRRVGQQRNVV